MDLGKPALLGRGSPSVNGSNNSSLLQAGGCRLKSITVCEVLGYQSNGGPGSTGERRAGRLEMALHDRRWRAACKPGSSKSSRWE